MIYRFESERRPFDFLYWSSAKVYWRADIYQKLFLACLIENRASIRMRWGQRGRIKFTMNRQGWLVLGPGHAAMARARESKRLRFHH